MKSAEKWAEEVISEYIKSDKYVEDKKDTEKKFKDFILYGIATTNEELSVDDILTRYEDVLT